MLKVKKSEIFRFVDVVAVGASDDVDIAVVGVAVAGVVDVDDIDAAAAFPSSTWKRLKKWLEWK